MVHKYVIGKMLSDLQHYIFSYVTFLVDRIKFSPTLKWWLVSHITAIQYIFVVINIHGFEEDPNKVRGMSCSSRSKVTWCHGIIIVRTVLASYRQGFRSINLSLLQ